MAAGSLTTVLNRIKRLVNERKVAFTLKALRELVELDLDPEGACDVLTRLTEADAEGRLRSSKTGEWMYVFKPQIESIVVYIKVIVRQDCVVISFHEDEAEH